LRILGLGLVVTSLATMSCKPRAGTSGVREIGGDPSVFSCDVARQQLDRVVPSLADAEKKATEAYCKIMKAPPPVIQPSTSTPSGGGPTPYSLTGDDAAAEPDVKPFTGSAGNSAEQSPFDDGDSPYCKEISTYITAQRKYVKGLNDRVGDPRDPCPAVKEDYTIVWEFPTCGTGNECSDRFNNANETRCVTCAVEGQDKSEITCQSEAAARDSVRTWCLRNPDNSACRSVVDASDAQIRCKAALPIDPQYAEQNKRMSGQYTFNSVTGTTRVYLNGQVRGSVGAAGNSAYGLIKGRLALDVAVGHEVINATDEQTFVRRGNRIEGNYKTKYRCTLWVAGGWMLGGEVGYSVGWMTPGTETGVTAQVSAGGEYERKGSTWSMTRNVTGAGKTEEQMDDDCKAYMAPRLMQDLQKLVEGFGVASPAGTTGAASARGAACMESKDCKNNDWQQWYGHCYIPKGGVLGTCGYAQKPGGECNVADEPPVCAWGAECVEASWMTFLGYKFNVVYKCRYPKNHMSSGK
jgi:hypothetical protein